MPSMNSLTFAILIMFLAVALLHGNPLYSDCPVGCPRNLNPVCATDGADEFHYFHNECLMRLDECQSGKAWSLALMSLCLPQVDPILRQKCIHACPFIYQPICATNGQRFQVFGNDCVFGVENCLSNGLWAAARDSDCEI